MLFMRKPVFVGGYLHDTWEKGENASYDKSDS